MRNENEKEKKPPALSKATSNNDKVAGFRVSLVSLFIFCRLFGVWKVDKLLSSFS